MCETKFWGQTLKLIHHRFDPGPRKGVKYTIVKYTGNTMILLHIKPRTSDTKAQYSTDQIYQPEIAEMPCIEH
jgi:hypothetical protein